MIMDPAHGAIGTEETDSRDVQKNNFDELRSDTTPHHQEARRVNNDPRAKQQKNNQQPRRDRR
ncbi:tRNA pseudouridine(55) synthase TruB, partial [Bradyrhizobium guangdongense]